MIATSVGGTFNKSKLAENPDRVDKIFNACLSGKKSRQVLSVHGPEITVVLNRNKLRLYKREISGLLQDLSAIFLNKEGGTLYDAQFDYAGRPWTGFEARVEKLVMLGFAIGFLEFVVPREDLKKFPLNENFKTKQVA